MQSKFLLPASFLALLLLALPGLPDDPAKVVDIADLTAGENLIRVAGPAGMDLGAYGVPVCGGADCDGDELPDYAVGHLRSSPLGRTFAGEVNLVFGDGTVTAAVDLELGGPRVLRILGEGAFGTHENCGSEVWMGDVTGDGVGDLLICRQNYSVDPDGGQRLGAGALTILVGGPELRALAEASTAIDLASPPPSVTLFTLVGPHDHSRMGMWVRAGDVDGDGTPDLVVGADQESVDGEVHHGAVYVVRGGAHLDQDATVDLQDFGTTILAGQIARVTPTDGADHYHFGSTLQTGDLDDNGKHELLVSAALFRAGAVLGPNGPNSMTTHADGGASPAGWAFIVWDDNFPAPPWPAGYVVDLEAPPGGRTIVRGGSTDNAVFGEELLGGMDFSADGEADLFIGDITGDGTGGARPVSGVGYVIYSARDLRGLDFTIDDAAALGIDVTKVLGPLPGAISSDTAAEGDFDGDGRADLAIGNPYDAPEGRNAAGSMLVLFGRAGGWPALIDMAQDALPPSSEVRITEVQGADGASGPNAGDTLCYSGAAADLDGDGCTDVITNEMLGNGTSPGTEDSGNLIVLSGKTLTPLRAFASYCFGDGGDAPCPCGNEAPSGAQTGCRNSTGAGGRLNAQGTSSVTVDDLQFVHNNQASNQTALLFSGQSDLGDGATFGDGLRCAGGNVVRLQTTTSDAFGDSFFGPGLAASGGWAAGEARFFQVWYRDPNGSPCGAGFNLSNGLLVRFEM